VVWTINLLGPLEIQSHAIISPLLCMGVRPGDVRAIRYNGRSRGA
jgi:hypothetical protein